MQTSETERDLVRAWVPRELASALKEHAIAADRSVSGEIRIALRKHLRNDNAARIKSGAVQESGEQARHAPV